MTPAPPDRRPLYEAANRQLDPDPELKARVRRGLDAAIAARAVRVRWLKGGAIMGAAVVGAVVAAISLRAPPIAPEPVAPEPTPIVEAVATPRTEPVPPPVATPEPVVPPVVVHRAPPKPAPAPLIPVVPSQPQASTLAEELRLVGGARTALVGGDVELAERLLLEHAARFPRGLLAEERAATLVDATCRAGRRDEARAQAVAFEEAWPASAHLPRVKAACTE